MKHTRKELDLMYNLETSEYRCELLEAELHALKVAILKEHDECREVSRVFVVDGDAEVGEVVDAMYHPDLPLKVKVAKVVSRHIVIGEIVE